jgi:chitinase
MRALYASQRAKTYYLSAAPSCYFPDASESLSILNQMDWVWPQFYSAPDCNLGTDGFETSLSAWSARLHGPKLYIGAASFPGATSSGGYEAPDAFAATVRSAKSLAKANFGGVMLWDGPHGHITMDSAGENFIAVSKEALEA